MSAELAHELKQTKARVPARARIVLALGPTTVLGGVVWALAQPWRLTLLHPHGQGFWWLFSEPPLYVVLVGVLFRLVVAPGIVADLAEQEPQR
jgi:uncharacterized membrane protein